MLSIGNEDVPVSELDRIDEGDDCILCISEDKRLYISYSQPMEYADRRNIYTLNEAEMSQFQGGKFNLKEKYNLFLGGKYY